MLSKQHALTLAQRQVTMCYMHLWGKWQPTYEHKLRAQPKHPLSGCT